MTIIEIPDREAAALTAKAAAQGLSLKAWLHQLADEPSFDDGDPAKLEMLREAARNGFNDIDRGDVTTLHSAGDISSLMQEMRETASRELASEREIA